MNSTRTVDYGIGSVESDEQQTNVTLHRVGAMPMPLDVLVTYQDGRQELFYIPLRIMRGEKENETDVTRTVLEDWPWTYPTYRMTVPHSASDIKSMVIDPTMRLADVDRSNNQYPADGETIYTPTPDTGK